MIELLASRKFKTLILGLVATLAARYGVDADLAQQVAALVIAYLVAQGVADHGKEAAQIRADARPTVTVQ